MIIHIALFKWKESASQEDIDVVMSEIIALKAEIKEIIEISCGDNFSQWSKGYTHAVVVKLNNKNSLEVYRSHPFHKRIVDRIEKIEEDSLGFDFEI